MIVIGADTHKGSHALAAVDEGTGKVRGSRQIKAEPAGHLAAVRWARELDGERVWAIEDCRACSRRLEQALIAAGERVVRVSPNRMGASRKGQREPGKSDEIDALAVARAVVKDGVDEFPVAFLDERAMEIRLLADHRNDLVAERTRTVNRLRWHLLELCPDLEASLRRGALNQARVLDRVDRQLRRLPASARVRIAREQISALRRLNREIDQLAADLAELIAVHRPALLDEQGCGPITAAILIGHTAGNQRFRSDAAFAMQTGTAPIPCSSGKRTQYRLNRGGDRQLNHALHVIAIARARNDPTTKQYLERKHSDGKTTKGALRSLKRHLARHFYQLLSQPPADQQPADQQPAVNELPIITPELVTIPERPLPPTTGPADHLGPLTDDLHPLKPYSDTPLSAAHTAATGAQLHQSPRRSGARIRAISADRGPHHHQPTRSPLPCRPQTTPPNQSHHPKRHLHGPNTPEPDQPKHRKSHQGLT